MIYILIISAFILLIIVESYFHHRRMLGIVTERGKADVCLTARGFRLSLMATKIANLNRLSALSGKAHFQYAASKASYF